MFWTWMVMLLFSNDSCCAEANTHIYTKGYFPHLKTTSCKYAFDTSIYDYFLPSSVDWRYHDMVTPVKNQGQCGSCWSFSATGAIEGIYAKYNKLANISEQQLIDCSTKYGNMGCNGGLMDNAFEYATDYYMCSEENVPYEGVVDKTLNECGNSGCNPVVKLLGCTDVPANNQTALKIAVSRQPVSVAIEADTKIFEFYTGGIITSTECGTTLDHGVLIVGYGSENGVDYWLLKNSWGTSWGENGYFRIKRDELDYGPGICGIASSASYPVLSNDMFQIH